MLKCLKIHTAAEHATAPAVSEERAASAPRFEELPRPTFTLDMTQAEWAFKESQWVAYIGLSAVSDQVKVQQLKAACEESLLRRVYDAGGLDSLNLLSQIKKLAQHSPPLTC